MDTRQKSARTAGLLYLLLACIGPFNTMYIPTRFIGAGIRRHGGTDPVVRVALPRRDRRRLASLVIFVLVVLALYRLLRTSTCTLRE
jgi:hypothetical protein